jgi:hypothetical protein
MSDKVDISFKLSNLVDRISGTANMTGKGKPVKNSKGARGGEGPPQPVVPQPGSTAALAAAAAASAGAAGGATASAGAAGGKPIASSSRQFMENFLQTAATPTKRTREENEEVSSAKRAAPEEEEEASEEEQQWQQEMRSNIEKEAGLTEEQVAKVMNIVMRAFRLRVVYEAKKVAMQIVREEEDVRKSYNSIIIHKADQWVKDGAEGRPFPPSFELTLAEKVTVGIHHMTGGGVAILDAYTLGRWDSPTPVNSVLVTFGSRAQKSTFFKILAKKATHDPKLRAISCRDAFPKKLVKDSKALADKGNSLRTSGAIASFRVVARGLGCIPVLEVKGWTGEGQREAKWRVYTEEPLPQRDGSARTPRRLTRAGTVPSTPLRPQGIQRLSVAGFEDATETVRLDMSDEEICTEEY